MAAADGRLEELFARAQTGDQEALDRLFTILRALITTLVTSDLGGRHRAVVDKEDLVQESCVRVFTSLQSYRWNGRPALVGYLRQVIGRTASGLREKQEAQKRHPKEAPASLNEGIVDHRPLPQVQVEEKERLARLVDALGRLSGDYRELIHLRDLEGLTLAAVARKLQRPPSTVTRDYYRARARLGRLLGVDMSPDGEA